MPEGKLDQFRLFKILRGALGSRATGMLYLTDNQSELSIRMSHGQPVDVQSNEKTNRLGQALVHEGLLSSTELLELNQRSDASKQPLVKIILNEGFVARRRLKRIESRLAKARLLPAFGWGSGWFRFDAIAIQDDPLIDPLDVVSLILEAVATVVPPPLCERFLQGFQGQGLAPTPWFETYGEVFDGLFPIPNLTRHVRGGSLEISGIQKLPGSRALLVRQGAALILSGMCKPAVAQSARVEPSGGVRRPPKAGTRQGAPVGGVSQTQSSSRPIVTAPPTPPAPPKATRRPPPVVKSRPIEPSPSQSPSGHVAKTVRSTADQGVSIPADVKPKDKERLEFIIELSGLLEQKNHYELLGVASNANEQLIRKKFRLLARDYHVDRFTRYGLSQGTVDAIQRVFIAFNRAHETLTDAHSRQEYDIALQMKVGKVATRAGSRGTDSQLQDVLKAEKMTEVAVALLSRGQSAPALDKLQKALETTPDDPLALAAKAYAEYLESKTLGGSKVVEAKSKSAITKVLKDNPNLAEAHLYLGRILRDIDELAEAIASFKAAVQINPHLAEASSELRFTKKKAEQSNSKGLKGLFGRKK